MVMVKWVLLVLVVVGVGEIGEAVRVLLGVGL